MQELVITTVGPEAVPPFWLRTEEHGIPIIDDRVLAVVENWQWAFCLTKKFLNEGACTPEVVEYVAIEVASRLRVDPREAAISSATSEPPSCGG